MNVKTLNEKVVEQIAGSNETVLNAVINQLANVEITRRQKAIVDGVTEVTKMRRDLYKIKPDILSYNEDATVKDAAWSKAKLEEKKKLEEKLTKWENAIEKALGEKADYSNLYNLVGGNDKAPATSTES